VSSVLGCPCNDDTSPWNNSIHIMVAQVHEITVFGVIEHPCNDDTSRLINSVQCNKYLHEIQCLL